MRLVKLKILVVVALAALGRNASAQDLKPVDLSAATGLTSIKMSHNLSIPLVDGDDPFQKQADAIQSFYGLVRGSCKTILDQIGETCEITNINLGSNTVLDGGRIDRDKPTRSIRLDARVEMLVRLKPDVGPVSAQNASRQRALPINRY